MPHEEKMNSALDNDPEIRRLLAQEELMKNVLF
jgi:hypothetical protein